MKLFSLNDDFDKGSNDKKIGTIKRDTFDLLISYLRGGYSLEEVKDAAKQLGGLGVLTEQEIVADLKARAHKEGCETSVGRSAQDLKVLWGRVNTIENM